MTVKYINDKGGLTIKGQKYNIAVVTEDGKSTLDGVTAAANKLAYDDKVQFVVGPNASFPVAAGPVFTPLGIMDVISFSTLVPGAVDKSTPHTYLGFASSAGCVECAGLAMKKEFPNIKTVAVTMPDDGAIPYLGPWSKKFLEANGVTIVGDIIGYANDQVDFNPIAAKLHAIKADAVFHINGITPHVANVLKGFRALGDTRPYIFTGAADAHDVITIAGAEACDNLITVNPQLNMPGNPPQLDAIGNAVQAKYGKQPLYLDEATSLYALCQVIQAANSIDPKDVEAQWVKMNTIETLFGPATPSGAETFGIDRHALANPLQYQITKKGQVAFGGWVTIPAFP